MFAITYAIVAELPVCFECKGLLFEGVGTVDPVCMVA